MTHFARAEHLGTPGFTVFEQERGGHHGFIFSAVGFVAPQLWLNDEQAASLAGYILGKVGAHEESDRKRDTEKLAEAVVAEVVAAVEQVEEAIAEEAAAAEEDRGW